MAVIPATRIVPAIAVPRQEPRLETLRDSPEISPCCASAKLDWTTFTDGVSIVPRPSPISSSPGAKAQASTTLHHGQQEGDAAGRDDEAGQDQRPLGERLGKPLGGERGHQQADVAAVKMTPVWIAS